MKTAGFTVEMGRGSSMKQNLQVEMRVERMRKQNPQAERMTIMTRLSKLVQKAMLSKVK